MIPASNQHIHGDGPSERSTRTIPEIQFRGDGARIKSGGRISVMYRGWMALENEAVEARNELPLCSYSRLLTPRQNFQQLVSIFVPA